MSRISKISSLNAECVLKKVDTNSDINAAEGSRNGYSHAHHLSRETFISSRLPRRPMNTDRLSTGSHTAQEMKLEINSPIPIRFTLSPDSPPLQIHPPPPHKIPISWKGGESGRPPNLGGQRRSPPAQEIPLRSLFIVSPDSYPFFRLIPHPGNTN